MLKLVDEDGNLIDSNDEACGMEAEISYDVPAPDVQSSPACRLFTLRQGCYNQNTCNGTVAVVGSGGGAVYPVVPSASPTLSPSVSSLAPTASSGSVVFRVNQTLQGQYLSPSNFTTKEAETVFIATVLQTTKEIGRVGGQVTIASVVATSAKSSARALSSTASSSAVSVSYKISFAASTYAAALESYTIMALQIKNATSGSPSKFTVTLNNNAHSSGVAVLESATSQVAIIGVPSFYNLPTRTPTQQPTPDYIIETRSVLAIALALSLTCCCCAAAALFYREYKRRHMRDSLLYDNGTELGRGFFSGNDSSANSPFSGVATATGRATEASTRASRSPGVPIFSNGVSFSASRVNSPNAVAPMVDNGSGYSNNSRTSSGGGFV